METFASAVVGDALICTCVHVDLEGGRLTQIYLSFP